ncbi:MAG: methyltransferase domain-containing protein [Planctomycetes bacterium]|nr:methyltransferase domain-containing protein [Planctomycetota bacterium]
MPELLACPSCRGPLNRQADALVCGCSTWPVVADIPLLVPWARNRRFSVEEALARHLPPPEGLAGKLLRRVFSGSAAIAEAISNRDATFIELAEALGRTRDLDYFRYRFSDLSYLSTAALLTPLDRGPLLDLGCGAGHLVHAMFRRLPKSVVVGLDLNFTLLYLAKRFVAPAALFVCADASAPLPFRDGAFEAALCADTFNYLPDRAAAARELLRAVRGPLLLSRLADPSFRCRGALAPLEPEAYLEMFSARSPRLYRDQDLLESFVKTRSLDLTRSAGGGNDVLTLTAGVEPKMWTGADYFVSGSQLNPIYESTEEGGSLRLRRRFVSEAYGEAYRKIGDLQPETLTVTRDQIALQDPELAKKFVLLDLPPNYC